MVSVRPDIKVKFILSSIVFVFLVVVVAMQSPSFYDTICFKRELKTKK